MNDTERAETVTRAIMVLMGAYFLLWRQVALPQMAWILAAGLCVHGLVALVARLYQRRHGSMEQMRLTDALVSLFVGVVLLRNNRAAATMVPLMMGVWALVVGVTKLIISVQYRDAQEPGWWTPLLGAVLSLGFGYLMITDLAGGMATSSFFIGCYLIIYGLSDGGELIVKAYIRKGKRHENKT